MSAEVATLPKPEPAASVPPDPSKSVTQIRLPTQQGPHGIRFDFNAGCQVFAPDDGSTWRVRLSDIPTGNVIYNAQLKPSGESGESRYHRVKSAKRYFIRFRIEVWRNDEKVFTHDYDAADKEVFVRMPVKTLGDTVGWMSYAVKVPEALGCRLTIGMAEHLIPLFEPVYPHIRFVPFERMEADRYYASYSVMLFYDDDAQIHQPCDFRLVGLHRTAAYILDVDPADAPPRVAIPDEPRPIPERYVCIASQATTQCKYWNNPNGWRELVAFLKEAGYRVICIDEKPAHGQNIVWNQIPHGSEDMTGRRPLAERALWLRHADFFVGLSSGLSWLAWAVGVPVVMIGGFTDPFNEFDTPYRVINYQACHGCWHDIRHIFDRKDFLWCPRHKGTSRQFECSKLISAEQVKAVIRTIPGFLSPEGDAGGADAPSSHFTESLA